MFLTPLPSLNEGARRRRKKFGVFFSKKKLTVFRKHFMVFNGIVTVFSASTTKNTKKFPWTFSFSSGTPENLMTTYGYSKGTFWNLN